MYADSTFQMPSGMGADFNPPSTTGGGWGSLASLLPMIMKMAQAGQGQQGQPQMAPRPMVPPQQLKPNLPQNPSQYPGTPGINPSAQMPVQSGPGAGVMTPQDIEMIKMLMQSGYKF